MPGFFPHLDQAALHRLRALVADLGAVRSAPMPREQLLRLASQVQADAGLTVDFEAAEQLGQPMIVLHAPERGAADRGRDAPARDHGAVHRNGVPTVRDGVADAVFEQLSKREREIAVLIADGLSNKQIAARLHITLSTVKDHVHRILSRTALPNRAALAALLERSNGRALPVGRVRGR